MTEARSYLLATLHHVAEGGDISNSQLNGAIPDLLLLDQVEKRAWEQLSHWADDADIRSKDQSYGAFKRKWMREHIVFLQS